ncbi:unnamed protein product, partial [Brenthis ino]
MPRWQESLVRIFNHRGVERGSRGVSGVWGAASRRRPAVRRARPTRRPPSSRPRSPAPAAARCPPARVTPARFNPARHRTKLNKFDKSSSYLDHYIDGRVYLV